MLTNRQHFILSRRIAHLKLSRTEMKFIITEDQYIKLKHQLELLLPRDTHASETGDYLITSLYFDDFYDSHVFEKADGIEYHQKFRIRTYSSNESRLEYKTKIGHMTNKQSYWLNEPLKKALIEHDKEVIYPYLTDPLIQHFFVEMNLNHLKPVLEVSYLREAFTYPVGDVRITFDKEIKASRTDTYHSFYRNILEPRTVCLEVKYTEQLPDFIAKVLFYKDYQVLSYSKYYMSWLLLIN